MDEQALVSMWTDEETTGVTACLQEQDQMAADALDAAAAAVGAAAAGDAAALTAAAGSGSDACCATSAAHAGMG